jgi:hypothetical protein
MTMSKEEVREVAQRAVDKMNPNPFGIKLAEDGIHELNDRWWLVIEASIEPPDRTYMWDAVATLEEMIEAEAPRIYVTAA